MLFLLISLLALSSLLPLATATPVVDGGYESIVQCRSVRVSEDRLPGNEGAVSTSWGLWVMEGAFAETPDQIIACVGSSCNWEVNYASGTQLRLCGVLANSGSECTGVYTVIASRDNTCLVDSTSSTTQANTASTTTTSSSSDGGSIVPTPSPTNTDPSDNPIDMPPNHVEPASGGAQTAAIVGGVVGGVSFVAVLATCLFCVRRKRRSARTRALYGFDQTSSDKGTGSGGLTGAVEADNSRWGWVTFNRNASPSEGGPLGASRSEITREPKGSVDLTLPPQARIANSPWAQFGDAEAQQFPPVPPIIHVPASLSIQDPFRTPAPTPKISIDLPPSYPAILVPNPHPVPQPASRPSLDLEGAPKRSRRVPVPTS